MMINGPDTVFPVIDDLFVDERNGHYLVLNPAGPRWFGSTRAIVLFVELCDGSRTIRDIWRLLAQVLPSITMTSCVEIGETLSTMRFFESGEKYPIAFAANVSFNITRICNLECPFCYYDSSPRAGKPENGELSVDEWVEIAKQVRHVNPSATIYVAGGEPLVRKDCVALLRKVSELDLKVKLITNGTLIRAQEVAAMKGIDHLTVQISIDSIVERENAASRGEHSLVKALKAASMLKSAGCRVEVSSTITQLNKRSQVAFHEYFASLGIRTRNSIFFVGGDRSSRNAEDLGFTPDEAWKLLSTSEAALSKMDKRGEKRALMRPSIVPGNVKRGCGVGYGTISIDPGGIVSPCNHLRESTHRLGDLRKHSIINVLTEGYKRFSFVDVDQMPLSGCRTCHVRYLCAGGCKASSYHAYGTLRRPPPDCTFLKKAHVEALWKDVLGNEYSSNDPDEREILSKADVERSSPRGSVEKLTWLSPQEYRTMKSDPDDSRSGPVQIGGE